MVALIIQRLHKGCSDNVMEAMVAMKFWVCLKQSHKGRQGSWSLTGCSNEAGGRHTHHLGSRVDPQRSATL